MFKQSFIDFKTKRTTSFFLLQELERVYGISKGFKYYWSLAVATKTDAVEMQKEMKKSTNKMSFRHQTCLLQQYSSSYYELFINICYILNDHLESKAEDMELQTESRINATLVAMAQISSGHIAQCRSLQHFVNASTLKLLPVIFFGSMEELLKALLTVQLEDLFVLLMYFMVAASKSTDDVITSSPAGRGLEWLRERVRPIDLSWLGTDRRGRPQRAEDGQLANPSGFIKEEFPNLEPVEAAPGEKTIQEQMNQFQKDQAERDALNPPRRRLNPQSNMMYTQQQAYPQMGMQYNPYGFQMGYQQMGYQQMPQHPMMSQFNQQQGFHSHTNHYGMIARPNQLIEGLTPKQFMARLGLMFPIPLMPIGPNSFGTVLRPIRPQQFVNQRPPMRQFGQNFNQGDPNQGNRFVNMQFKQPQQKPPQAQVPQTEPREDKAITTDSSTAVSQVGVQDAKPTTAPEANVDSKQTAPSVNKPIKLVTRDPEAFPTLGFATKPVAIEQVTPAVIQPAAVKVNKDDFPTLGKTISAPPMQPYQMSFQPKQPVEQNPTEPEKPQQKLVTHESMQASMQLPEGLSFAQPKNKNTVLIDDDFPDEGFSKGMSSNNRPGGDDGGLIIMNKKKNKKK